ncbi:protein mono-ADP-ribosyltransferase TIPARP-like isoform X2 [Dermochelys coriacea]|uniref:protein mono-ADP-ribosyltransferase TIPARP-like isoform X2 n=1 Tax=Dermochelys coriacea TaxID=27794 RepID=UPI0018E7E4B9|nr:protein mono-ADP-ribosyltransferase TIPARP-like isoform X2 [Dermochelys coriacea]
MAAGSDAPAAPPPARLARLKRSHRSAFRPPVVLRIKAQAQLLHRRPPEPGGAAPAPGPPSPAPPAPAGDPYGETVELALREAEAAPEPTPGAGPGCEELTLDHLLEIVAQLEYHTHPEDGVDICPHFLLGCCFSGARCPQHHTLLPYHWQLWQSASLPPGWLSVGPEAHETLERLYSDPERTHVRASYQGVTFDIDLVAMQVWNSPSFTRVRRLETSPAPGTPFRTTRLFYWKALGGWEPYSEPFTQSIEAALRSGQEEALCSTAEHSYRLDLRAGYQRNLATGTLRPLRARPAFRAPALLLPELRKQSHMSRQMSPEQRLRNERHLFHGTSAGAVPAICKHNLDPRLSGKHAALYGQGSYFARRASYSHRYAPPAEAGLRHVFLCKVLVGRSALGQPALRRPPPLDAGDPASDLYDSCVDSLSDPQIYVVFDSDQCYPYFLLQYRQLEEVVKVD